MASNDLSPADAEVVVLGRLALIASGLSALDLEADFAARGPDNLYGRQLTAALDRLVGRGELRVEGAPELRIYVVTDKGRARLGGEA